MSESERERVVREAFMALADEFLQRVDVSESGSLRVHYQNGIPLKRDYEFGGRIRPARLTTGTDG